MHSFAKEESTKRAAANGGAKMRLAPEGARSDVPITFLKRQQGHAPGHASYAVHAVDPSSVPFEEERNTIKLGYAVRDTRNLPPGQQQDLYATDTESIGDSMIGSSINGFTRGQRGFTADTRPAVEIGTDNGEPDDGESGSDDEPGSGEEEEEEEEDDGVEGALRRVEQEAMSPLSHSVDHGPDPAPYPRSYPSTTSGHPESPPNEYQEGFRDDQWGQRESTPPPKGARFVQELAYASHGRAQITGPIPVHAHTTRPSKQLQTARPTKGARDHGPIDNDSRQQTQSGPHITKRSSVARGRSPVHLETAPTTSSLAVNLSGTSNSLAKPLQQDQPRLAVFHEKQGRVVAIPTIYSESHAQQDYHTPGEPGSHIPISRAAQEQRLDNPVSQGADYQDGNGVVIQEEENPYKELDYDPQELFEKTYESLTAENFDFDPLPMAKLPEGLADASLEDKLSSMAGQDAPAQAQFFNTLDIHQWEEAGDWFLDRFSDVLTRLKTARREKRGLARAFENEVEQRHEAVSRKRKATESALEDMKKNGGMVLQRTPKKQKQKYKQ